MSATGPPYDVYQCYDCPIGLTSNPNSRCDNCGGRDWTQVVDSQVEELSDE